MKKIIFLLLLPAQYISHLIMKKNILVGLGLLILLFQIACTKKVEPPSNPTYSEQKEKLLLSFIDFDRNKLISKERIMNIFNYNLGYRLVIRRDTVQIRANLMDIEEFVKNETLYFIVNKNGDDITMGSAYVSKNLKIRKEIEDSVFHYIRLHYLQ